jgi:glycosyltransferase involved in cell wall biosynthesis
VKILLVNTRGFRGGGDGIYTLDLADLLRQHGHSVSFFAMQDERNLPDPNADLFVSHIDFRELNQHKSFSAGVRTARRAIYSSEARQKFRRLLDRVQPDIVHLQNIHGHLTPSVIFEAKDHGLPLLWTLHDYKLICPNTTFLIDRTGQVCEACGSSAYYQPLLKRCKKGSLAASGLASLEAYIHSWLRVRDRVDAFLVPSLFLRDKLLSRGFAPERLHHLPNFVPDTWFMACGLTQARNYILFMGRLEAIKGIACLLEACRLVPDIRLVLAGSADAAVQLEWLGKLPPNAEYVGFKQGEELRRLVCGAAAVVVPSIWYENQPLGIIEAFASRRPVIASNLGGMAELVIDQERGLVVPPGEPRALAEAMRWLVSHLAEAGRMGEAAYRYANAEHSAGKHYERLEALYSGCMRQRQPGCDAGNR